MQPCELHPLKAQDREPGKTSGWENVSPIRIRVVRQQLAVRVFAGGTRRQDFVAALHAPDARRLVPRQPLAVKAARPHHADPRASGANPRVKHPGILGDLRAQRSMQLAEQPQRGGMHRRRAPAERQCRRHTMGKPLYARPAPDLLILFLHRNTSTGWLDSPRPALALANWIIGVPARPAVRPAAPARRVFWPAAERSRRPPPSRSKSSPTNSPRIEVATTLGAAGLR